MGAAAIALASDKVTSSDRSGSLFNLANLVNQTKVDMTLFFLSKTGCAETVIR